MEQGRVWTGDGAYDQAWAGVVLVWVGSATGLRLRPVSQPVLSLFTAAGLEYAARAGTRVQPLVTVPVAGHLPVPDLCGRLRRLTDAEVVDGTRTSRRAAAATLTATPNES